MVASSFWDMRLSIACAATDAGAEYQNRIILHALSHLVVQNGVTDAAVVETRLTAADGGTFDADVVFFDPSWRRLSWKCEAA